MSKFQLPTSKAGEAFPTTIQAPVAVRFAGVPAGSPLARELYAALQGPINQFYSACAQNYALGLGAHARMQRELPHAQLSYTNNHGSETVHVRVSRELQEHAARQLRRPTPWDFAVIEIEVPDLVKTNACFGAFLGGKTTNLAGVAEDYGSSGGYTYGSPPILQFADFNQPIIDSISGVTKRITSLKVDLRPFRTATAISVDIHGYIKTFNDYGEPITSSTPVADIYREVIGHWPNWSGPYGQKLGGEYLVYDTSYTYAQILDWFPELSGIPVNPGGLTLTGQVIGEPGGTFYLNGAWNNGRDPNDPLSQFSGPLTTTETFWPGTSIRRKIVYAGGQWSGSNSTSGDAPGPFTPVDSNLGTFIYYSMVGNCQTQFNKPDLTYGPQYITRNAELRSVFFRGNPMSQVTDQYGSGKEYAVWEDPKLYPARPKFVTDRHTVAMTTIDEPVDTSVENKFGMPKLGTLTLLIQDGSIAWKPA